MYCVENFARLGMHALSSIGLKDPRVLNCAASLSGRTSKIAS